MCLCVFPSPSCAPLITCGSRCEPTADYMLVPLMKPDTCTYKDMILKIGWQMLCSLSKTMRKGEVGKTFVYFIFEVWMYLNWGWTRWPSPGCYLLHIKHSLPVLRSINKRWTCVTGTFRKQIFLKFKSSNINNYITGAQPILLLVLTCHRAKRFGCNSEKLCSWIMAQVDLTLFPIFCIFLTLKYCYLLLTDAYFWLLLLKNCNFPHCGTKTMILAVSFIHLYPLVFIVLLSPC